MKFGAMLRAAFTVMLVLGATAGRTHRLGFLRKPTATKASVALVTANRTNQPGMFPGAGAGGGVSSMWNTPGAQEPQYFGGQRMEQEQGGSDGDCHPKCWWSCGSQGCDEKCEPVCAPPQCETACAPINLATCAQKCEPPKCAVVCPTIMCEHGKCPGCKTICGPPKCETVCAEQCESKCNDPQCTWKCKPDDKCEKPKCGIRCESPKICSFDGSVGARPPPFAEGMNVIAKGMAALDPKELEKIAKGK
eukprot:gnl/TRDRNA2_/TRDRNA2_186364_c0_seq1.p1 gnl/TRDRNA2_/TRDRNA2_186364_c0~~gnl/TRDRNA2_/TRDRNA2_186364_c0_seq1.p1  ORF type:complete len:249 (-),score=41.29 gnl/TRDRNA2_/TRDRNA2_186364_c0_seq1:66-812(-)